MKKLLVTFSLMIMYGMVMAVPCPDRIQASAASGTVSTNSSGGGNWCNSTGTLVVCEDEFLKLRYHPSDWGSVSNNGYVMHYFEARNTYTNTVTSFGLFINNNWQNASLPPGHYEITAFHTNSNGTYQSAIIKVRVIEIDVPIPTLSAGPYCINTPITVTGVANYTASTDYTGETINMGDGTILTPNQFGGGAPWNPYWEQINTTHSYSTPGFYTITVSRTYPCGVRTADTTIYVGPTPTFSVNNVVCKGSEVAFTLTTTCLSQIDAGTLLWEFGDGFTSTLNNPTHIYTTAGEFTPKLSFNVGGVYYSTINGIEVLAGPTVDLGADYSFCPNELFPWPWITTQAGYSSYKWTHNGGNIEGASGNSISTFDWGTYCVTVTDENGCKASDCMSVTQKPTYDPIDPDYNITLTSSNCQFYLSVFPNDTRAGLYHQWYIYKNQPAGTTNGGTLDTHFNGTSWNGSSQLPYTFDGGTWYWIKHGVWSDCDPWVEKRQAYFWICKTGEVLSISEEQMQAPGLYPNPASDQIHLTGFMGKVQVNLYGMDGKLHHSYEGEPEFGLPLDIDLSQVGSGVYFLQASDSQGNNLSQKVVVD